MRTWSIRRESISKKAQIQRRLRAQEKQEPKKRQEKKFSFRELMQIFAITFFSKDVLGRLWFSGELLIQV